MCPFILLCVPSCCNVSSHYSTTQNCTPTSNGSRIIVNYQSLATSPMPQKPQNRRQRRRRRRKRRRTRRRAIRRRRGCGQSCLRLARSTNMSRQHRCAMNVLSLTYCWLVEPAILVCYECVVVAILWLAVPGMYGWLYHTCLLVLQYMCPHTRLGRSTKKK